jgi:hypothetical protein
MEISLLVGACSETPVTRRTALIAGVALATQTLIAFSREGAREDLERQVIYGGVPEDPEWTVPEDRLYRS